MIMRGVFWTVVFVLGMGNLFAEQPNLRLDVDFAHFRGVEDSLYIELYYSFPAQALTYELTDDLYTGTLEIDVSIFDRADDDVSIKDRSFHMNYTVEDTTGERLNQSVVGQSALFLPPGEYRLKVKGVDTANPANADSVSFPLDLTDLPDTRVAVSDIQFANSIQQIPEDPHSSFYKNTLEVIPNPSRIFGVGQPILFYYLEVYNLLEDALEGEEYNVRTAVYDAIGNQFYERENIKERVHESSVEVGTVNTTAFQSGTYTLSIAIVDPASNIVVSSSRRFFVFNPQHGIAEGARDEMPGGVVASIYSVMTEEELDKEFEQMRYITSSQDRREFGDLEDKKDKQQFLFEFWRQLDPDPGSPENLVRQEYLSRIHHVNERFGFGSREGWRSDRGRIYITYGPPDEYERYPSRIDTKPYEIWHYHQLQGGVIFVFVDRTGFDDYQLVHSTHRNELRDDNWRQYIRQN